MKFLCVLCDQAMKLVEMAPPDRGALSGVAVLNGLVMVTFINQLRAEGDDLDDVSARGLEGFLTMADAINRAGSTDHVKIRDALKATNLPAAQMVTGYNGVKFDDKGQNTLASSLITQMRGGKYVAIWPKERATDTVTLPYKGW